MKATFLKCIALLVMSSSMLHLAESYDFDQQMKTIAQKYFLIRPEMATYLGLPDKEAGEGTQARSSYYSPADEKLKRQSMQSMLNELEVIDQSTLTAKQKLSLALITVELKAGLEPAKQVEYGSVLGEYGFWFLPYAVSHLSGAHIEFPSLMEDKFAVTNEKLANDYLSRLNNYNKVITGLIEKIDDDKALGVVPPDFVIDNTIKNLQLQINKSIDEHSLVTSYAIKLKTAAIKNPNSFIDKAKKSMQMSYYPATQQLIDKMKSLRDVAKHDAGIGHLPKGNELYRAMISHMTDTKRTPEDIHALGLSEVARISKEMDRLLNKIGYKKGTVGERMGKLLKDPKYLYPNTKEGKADLLNDIKGDITLVNNELHKWFGMKPEQDVAVKIVPEHLAASTSGAFYDGPSQDGTRPGTFWIALNDTAMFPSYSLQTLTYHETNPGHHLQTLISLSDDLPALNALFYSNAFGEGWALYAERLASEMGIYDDDPVDDVGRLQAELHRAVRLVVDTGMHAFGWSREKAIDYSVATEGIHISEATGEIERYTVWPGQALGYKLGELKIRELREKAKKTLGEKFDIKLFHDKILEDGALPLNVLESKINTWLEAN